MEMPGAAKIREVYLEVLDRVQNVHLKRFPGHEEPVFLISNAYPGVWLEHAYDAICYARFEEGDCRAVRGQLKLFLDAQKPDGQLPCCVLDASNPRTAAYHCAVSYGQIQECVSFARLCLEGATLLGDEALLREAYEKCARWEAWLVRNRMTTGRGLVETFCVFDTGHDNSARFAGIPGGCPERDAKRVNACDCLPILSPDVNSVFYGTRSALSDMARALGKNGEADMWLEKAEDVRAKLLKICYDPETEFFYDVDREGNFRKFLSIAAASLFQEHVIEGELAKRVYERHFKNPAEFWTKFPFPSMAASDPSFEKRRDGNDWGYYSEGLTALRALRWMDDYGRGDDLSELLSRWVMAFMNARETRFAQELDPFTGEASKCSEWYSSSMLLFLHGIKRLKLC